MTAMNSNQGVPEDVLRFTAYLQALRRIPDDEELSLITTILEDSDATAQSAVLRHLDQRADTLLRGEGYVPWAQAMTQVVAPRPFLIQRLHEWSLFRAVILSQPWSLDALTRASNWLQLKIAESQSAIEAVEILAQAGRTKRIRNTARTTLVQRSRG
ncbi:hypothetical protein [Streptomyces cadmiisoli]|uniref:hypothetical protein n=1 Tax=Streptomyces cadmiisoli TaxID=2184053 RepID=UPI003648A522